MGPVRTCIGCRSNAARSRLVRVVVVRDRIVVDAAARLPGRGAWLHPDPACIERACAARAFGRALRTRDRLDLAEVHELARRLAAEASAARTEKKADRIMDDS